jgi:hypothetical protein
LPVDLEVLLGARIECQVRLGAGEVQMSLYLQELVKLFGGLAVLAAALAWLTKSIISHFLSKDIEVFKGQLSRDLENHRHQLDLQSESFKTNLQVLAQEHLARFTKLHDKRVEILAEMYYQLEDAYTAISALNLGCEGPSKTQTLVPGFTEDAVQKTLKLFDFFRRNKLYFSKQLAQEIQSVVFELQSLPFDLSMVTGSGHKPEEIDQCRLKFIEDWKKQSSQLLDATCSVETEFRRLLASDGEAVSGASSH